MPKKRLVFEMDNQSHAYYYWDGTLYECEIEEIVEASPEWGSEDGAYIRYRKGGCYHRTVAGLDSLIFYNDATNELYADLRDKKEIKVG